MPPPALLPLLLVAGAGAAVEAAPADEDPRTLSVRTSLGPLGEDDETRALRARGRAPRGSRLTVTFTRYGRRVGAVQRIRLRGTDRVYGAARDIDRIGDYRVRVIARTPSGDVLRVAASLVYGPRANAPSAPGG